MAKSTTNTTKYWISGKSVGFIYPANKNPGSQKYWLNGMASNGIYDAQANPIVKAVRRRASSVISS